MIVSPVSYCGYTSMPVSYTHLADVPIHSIRMKGLLSHQEVLFSNEGELLTIRHDSFSSESFAPGIIAAIRYVRSLKGLEVGLKL